MAQHDYNIANQTGLEFRADLNNLAQAIATQNSGPTEPTTTYAGMVWLDTSTSPPTEKRRNQANDGWVVTLSEAGRAVAGADDVAAQLSALALTSAAKTDVAQNFTAPQRSAVLTDNDGSFDLSAKQNFKCTTAGAVTLTFTNQADGLSGAVIFINASNHVVSAHANTKISAAALSRLSATGTYRIDYMSDGTNAYCTVSENLA